MTFKEGDRVRIGLNGYLDFGDPEISFVGETGRIEKVEVNATTQMPFAYQVSLDNKAKHNLLAGGDDFDLWPFFADELEKIDA